MSGMVKKHAGDPKVAIGHDMDVWVWLEWMNEMELEVVWHGNGKSERKKVMKTELVKARS